MVRKIVRSLLDRFQPKIVAIEESKNLDIMKVDDLMSSLLAFEMNLKSRRKEKSIAFKTTQESVEPSNEENDDDELALLTKNFKKFLKNVGKNSKTNSSSTKNTKGKTFSKSVDSLNKKGI